MNRHALVLASLLCGLAGCSSTQTRGQAADEVVKDDPDISCVKVIGDITEVGGAPIAISGVGLVTHLDDTGGGAPPGDYRSMLEKQLRTHNVDHIQELLASKKCAVVLVNGVIFAGKRKGDYIDVEITLPPQSKTTSLRGGILLDCNLEDYAVGYNNKGNQRLYDGHTLAHASGPLVVGLGDGTDDARLVHGCIWGDALARSGAVTLIDAPFSLFMKNDQKCAVVANAIANRINAAFPDDAQKQYLVRQTQRVIVQGNVANGINERFPVANSLGRGQAAQTSGKDIVYVNVPVEYRLNPERFVRVICDIPLSETPETRGRYRKRLEELLLDPRDTILAALRLEALGKQSIAALTRGLASKDVLVRFASAESLTYLGSTAGIEELGRLAIRHETIRGNCLIALAGLNESSSLGKLMELLASPVPEVRVGAFGAIVTMNDINLESASNRQLRGELFGNSFWLHHVAPQSTPLVHVSTRSRSEVVVFGEEPMLVPPFKIASGDYVVAAAANDKDSCTVTGYYVKNGRIDPQLCPSCKLVDVVRKIAAMGGQYADVVEFLAAADQSKRLTCTVMVDAPVAAAPVALLAFCGGDANQFKDKPEGLQELLAAQQDLGITPRAAGALQR